MLQASPLPSSPEHHAGNNPPLTRQVREKKFSFRIAEPYLYLIPCLFFVMLFVYYPFAKTVIGSFYFVNKEGILRNFAGFTNYVELFQDKTFFIALKNSILYTVMLVPISLFLSLTFALLANKESIFNKFSTIVFMLPMAISVSIAAMIFNLLMNPTIGLFDYILNIHIPWYTDSNYALSGLAIFNVWLTIGFNFIFLTSAIRNVPNELIESANLEGANWFKKTIFIVIPLISPTLFFLFCTLIVDGMMMASSSIVLTKGGPNMSTTTLIYQMYIQAYQNGNYSYSFALTVIIFLIVGSLLALSFKFEKKGGILRVKQINALQDTKNASYYVIGFVTLLLALLTLSPVIYCLTVSFMPMSDINSYPPKWIPKSFYLGNYAEVIHNTLIFRFMLNSLILAFFGTLVRIITSSTAAFAFSFFNFRLKKLLFFIIMGSMVIPYDALLVSNYLTVSSMGLIDTYLGVMIIYFANAMYMFMLRQHMMTLPKDLHEAAVMDGCGSFRFFTTIILPICQPATVSVFIASFVGLWNAYMWPLLVTNAPEMRTVQIGITMLSTDEATAFGPIMAASIIVLIPMILVYLIFSDKIISGVTAGSVKG